MPWQIIRKPGIYRVDVTANLDGQQRPKNHRVFDFSRDDSRFVDGAGNPLDKPLLVAALRKAVKDQLAVEASPLPETLDILDFGAGAV